MPRRKKVKPEHKSTTILFKAGRVPATVDEMFSRVFWRSPLLASEAKVFCEELVSREPSGISVGEWRSWVGKRKITVGQFYNMIRGLVGAGIVEKREGSWHISTGFLRELEQFIIVYTSLTNFEHRLG
jgi:uncharacterized membrane protein YeaQ/YmgE (transglycosylase-associated protein family)